MWENFGMTGWLQGKAIRPERCFLYTLLWDSAREHNFKESFDGEKMFSFTRLWYCCRILTVDLPYWWTWLLSQRKRNSAFLRHIDYSHRVYVSKWRVKGEDGTRANREIIRFPPQSFQVKGPVTEGRNVPMVRCLLTLNPTEQSRPPTSVGLLRIWGLGEKGRLASTIGQGTQLKEVLHTVLTPLLGPFLSVCSQAEEIQKHHYMVKVRETFLEIDMQISTPCSPLCSKISLPWDLGKHPSEEGSDLWRAWWFSSSQSLPLWGTVAYYFPVWSRRGKTEHAPTNDRGSGVIDLYSILAHMRPSGTSMNDPSSPREP